MTSNINFDLNKIQPKSENSLLEELAIYKEKCEELEKILQKVRNVKKIENKVRAALY